MRQEGVPGRKEEDHGQEGGHLNLRTGLARVLFSGNAFE